jgi:hypothetical protein
MRPDLGANLGYLLDPAAPADLQSIQDVRRYDLMNEQ